MARTFVLRVLFVVLRVVSPRAAGFVSAFGGVL